MKKILLGLAAIGLVSVHSANAYTKTLTLSGWTQAADDGTTLTFDYAKPDNVAVSLTPDAKITSGNLQNVSAQPFEDTSKYLTVGITGSASLQYSSPQKEFSLLWGSIDTYNKVAFFLNGAPVAVVTGADLIGQDGPPIAGSQAFDGTAQVTIAGLIYDQVILTNSPGQFAFEVDNIKSTSVPDGGLTVTMLGLAMTGIAMVRRKFNA